MENDSPVHILATNAANCQLFFSQIGKYDHCKISPPPSGLSTLDQVQREY